MPKSNYKILVIKNMNLMAPTSSEYFPNPIIGGIATINDIPQTALTHVLVSMVSWVTEVKDRSNPTTDLQRIAAKAVIV